MPYELARLIPHSDAQYRQRTDDESAKGRAAEFLHDAEPGTYLLLAHDDEHGRLDRVVTTFDVRTTTAVNELLARFDLP